MLVVVAVAVLVAVAVVDKFVRAVVCLDGQRVGLDCRNIIGLDKCSENTQAFSCRIVT